MHAPDGHFPGGAVQKILTAISDAVLELSGKLAALGGCEQMKEAS